MNVPWLPSEGPAHYLGTVLARTRSLAELNLELCVGHHTSLRPGQNTHRQAVISHDEERHPCWPGRRRAGPPKQRKDLLVVALSGVCECFALTHELLLSAGRSSAYGDVEKSPTTATVDARSWYLKTRDVAPPLKAATP